MNARLNDLLFYLLLFGLLLALAWLSQRLPWQWDWTRLGNNSLSPASIRLLQQTDGPLQITAYAPRDGRLRDTIQRFIQRYRHYKPDLSLRFVDPARHPDETRRQGIHLSGELLLGYQGRQAHLQQLDEPHLSNAILRLTQSHQPWVAGISGHGERSLLGSANFDLGEFAKTLREQGFTLVEFDLATTPRPPDNTDLLLIASPQQALLPAELTQLARYLERGGNLLLLIDPGNDEIQRPLLDLLGLRQLPGTIVDANARQLGLDNPTMALVPQYPDQPPTAGFKLLSLYPQAAALESKPGNSWRVTPLLRTQERSWNETGRLTGEIQRDPGRGERAGPLTLGYALSRDQAGKAQRVVVVGDGDFLANRFIANAGNRQLGLALVHWLSDGGESLGIPQRQVPDRALHLAPLARGLIGLGWLILLPLLLLIAGGLLSWRRRRA